MITEPPPGPVTLEAVSANDRALPAFINANGSTAWGIRLTEASLRLQAPDSLRLVLSTQYVAEDGVAEPETSDTLRAHVEAGDSTTLLLSQLGNHPLMLDEQAILGRDRSILVTVRQPHEHTDEVEGTYPVELLFRY